MAAKKKTQGTSPKVPAAGAAALFAPLLARILAGAFGVEVDEEWLEGVLLAAIAAVSAIAAAWAAPPGNVVTRKEERR